MAAQVPIRIKLFVVLGNGHLGPVDLTISEHHTPDAMIAHSMDDVFDIPQEMRTQTKRLLYSLRTRAILKPGRSYRDQNVANGDILVLTDQGDDQLLFSIAHVLANQAGIALTELRPQETRLKAVLRGAIQGIPWVGPALEALVFGPKGDN